MANADPTPRCRRLVARAEALRWTRYPAGLSLSLLGIALPFFALIACGYLARRTRLVADAGLAGINQFLVYFALPAFVFSRVTDTSGASATAGPFLLAYGLACFSLLGLGLVFSRWLFRAPVPDAAIHGLGAAFSNTGYLGLPLAIALYGEAASVPAVLIFTFDNTVLILLTAVLLEVGRGTGTWLARVAGLLGQLFGRNPLIVAILAALLLATFAVPIPEALRAFTRLLGNAAGPAGLFALGASLAARQVTGSLGQVTATTMLKLIVHPVVMAWAMLAVSADPLWARTAITSAALPVGASVYVLAAQYNVQVAPASAVVLISTVASVVTLSALLAFLGLGPG